jgi:hypothetical protein
LEHLLADYNEGRSCSFYCIAAALLPTPLTAKSVGQAQKTIAAEEIADSDIKSKAKILRATIQDFASKADVDLKLRHHRK